MAETTTRNLGQVVSTTPTATPPADEKVKDVAERAATTEGKDVAELDTGEALAASVAGELSTNKAPVGLAVQPESDLKDAVIAPNGLPYVGTDPVFYATVEDGKRDDLTGDKATKS